MLTLNLNEDEVTQLYVLMSLLEKTGELRKGEYTPGGPARTLAKKIAEFLVDFPGSLEVTKNTGAKKCKDVYVATVIENDPDQSFASHYHGDSPEELLQKVKKHLQTECDERDLHLEYDEKELLSELHGNEDSGPFRIIVKDWDTEFLVSAKKIVVTL